MPETGKRIVRPDSISYLVTRPIAILKRTDSKFGLFSPSRCKSTFGVRNSHQNLDCRSNNRNVVRQIVRYFRYRLPTNSHGQGESHRSPRRIQYSLLASST